jgi:hypothetical protein
MPREQIEATAKELGLTMETVFVPFSQSRNKGEKHQSLNWSVTIKRNGRDILPTDYSAGCAHCPAYKNPDKPARDYMIQFECEHGTKAQGVRWSSTPEAYGSRRDKIEPDFCDVLYSLSMDSDVIDASGFEEWASNFGYETDSRKAESIYRACLDIALKLRAALGEEGLAKLREACQDY